MKVSPIPDQLRQQYIGRRFNPLNYDETIRKRHDCREFVLTSPGGINLLHVVTTDGLEHTFTKIVHLICQRITVLDAAEDFDYLWAIELPRPHRPDAIKFYCTMSGVDHERLGVGGFLSLEKKRI